ncbi:MULTISPECIES: EutP/PduV family microcompartment system protein [Anaerotruncus]|jgi:ethanolamine utilization protein EutP|uniref:EutP/PduV family microcompartment system protein n=1 Tax=Anaerotruncus TaxID=244127 RepID=UPI000E49C444|nr:MULTISPECIES: EutP/PduV family microcompartment system protein [Anaerotruncus]RGX55223.1 ethanolamine utilization protein EutP [Anaerotruncus sp. AF02-27]
MKKIMLIGKIGCGKTRLGQCLLQEKQHYKKTQAIEVLGGSLIDTPGEYIEQKQFYKALVVTAVEADCILMLQSCNDEQCAFSPRMYGMFNRPLIGVVTKMDLCETPMQAARAGELLRFAGAQEVFFVSSATGKGIKKLLAFLK